MWSSESSEDETMRQVQNSNSNIFNKHLMNNEETGHQVNNDIEPDKTFNNL